MVRDDIGPLKRPTMLAVVEIQQPTEGDVVPLGRVRSTGSFTGLQDGWTLAVLVQPETTPDLWFPQPEPLLTGRADGTWSTTVRFGLDQPADRGMRFTLAVVEVDSGAAAELSRHVGKPGVKLDLLGGRFAASVDVERSQ